MDPAFAALPLFRHDVHVVRLSDALAALLGPEIYEGAELSEDEFVEALRAAGLVTYPSPPTAEHHAPAAHADASAAQPPAVAASAAAVAEGARRVGLVTSPSPPPNAEHQAPATISAAQPAATATATATATAASTAAAATAATVAAAAGSTDQRVMHLAGALAALLGHAEGAEITEDEVLGRLRQAGLITYPSPLLGRLLEELRDLFAAEVLPHLDPTTLALFSGVGGACRAAVVSSGLPRAGTIGGESFEVSNFVATVPLLAWAKAKGCPWNAKTCEYAAMQGQLDSLQWARENHCPWDGMTCASAAFSGRLEVLQWAREQGCPWDFRTCGQAAFMGRFEVLQWARGQDPPCPWDAATCAGAAGIFSSVEMLPWAREQGCPWDARTCATAALCGRLDVLQWARERDCPWDWTTLWGAHQGSVVQVDPMKPTLKAPVS